MRIYLPKYFMIKDLSVSGIYFLIKKGRIIYIGKTKNVISRVWSHELNGLYDAVRVICCDEADLNKYEMRWIIRFRPKYNRQHLFKRSGGWRIGYSFEKINLNS